MSDLPSEPPAEKRKMTDWPVRYFHGHRINVQRWEDNRVARVTKVNDDGSREVLLIEPMGVTQRLGFRLDDQLHALADLEALPLDSWTPHAAPSVSSSAPPPTWDEMASMFPDNSKRANRPRGSSAEPAPPSQVPWAGPVTYDQAYQRARNAGFTANDAHNAARSHPKATKPFPWRIEIKAPDDVSIVCGEFGGTSTQFSRIAECHTIDDARFIVACCNAWALRDEKPQPVVEKYSLSPVQEEATPTPKNQRIEVSITITGGDGVQRHELAGTIQMQARNAAKKRGLTVDCCTTNDEGL